MTAHVLAGSDAGFVFEHAREMMWVIEAEHVCRFADTSAAQKIMFFCNFCKIGSYSANLCLRISKKSSTFAPKFK